MQVIPRSVDVTRIRSPNIPEKIIVMVIRIVRVISEIFVYEILLMFLAKSFDREIVSGMQMIDVATIVIMTVVSVEGFIWVI